MLPHVSVDSEPGEVAVCCSGWAGYHDVEDVSVVGV